MNYISRLAVMLSAAAMLVPTLPVRAQDKPAPKPSPTDISKETGWKDLFDGKTLGDFKPSELFGGGKAHVEPKCHGDLPAIVLDAGQPMSGITWVKPDKPKEGAAKFELPKTNYELYVEAIKLEGDDFFLGLTFPVAESHATLIMGGWGGKLVGISSLDKMDASENETCKLKDFEINHWYRVRLKVTPNKLEAWVDNDKLVSVSIKEKAVSLRPGPIEKCKPLGLATYKTSAAYRAIKVRTIEPTVAAGMGTKYYKYAVHYSLH